MFCKNCGKEIACGTKFCPECGSSQETDTILKGKPSNQREEIRGKACSQKSRTITALLAFLLGFIGVHRFYVGKVGTGILLILCTCCFGLGVIWAFIDLIVILCGNFTDKDGQCVTDWTVKY